MIPPFDANGNLPPGIHWATWEEVVERFGGNAHRQMLLRGLRNALESLRAAGCKVVYLNGSFVTAEENPHDYDACWETEGVQPLLIDPVMLEFDNTLIQKAKYRGELYPVDSKDKRNSTNFLQFFQKDKETNIAKGIIGIELKGLSL